MSRQREVAPGLRFGRPPGQDKVNIFSASKEDFAGKVEALTAAVKSGEPLLPPFAPTLEQWLINSYTGVGPPLSQQNLLPRRR